jgi:hypothetical protein
VDVNGAKLVFLKKIMGISGASLAILKEIFFTLSGIRMIVNIGGLVKVFKKMLEISGFASFFSTSNTLRAIFRELPGFDYFPKSRV